MIHAFANREGREVFKPKDAGYKVTANRGLYLRVTPDGTKTWLVRHVSLRTFSKKA